ncbi:MAG TPA: type II secretion system inner membrane protein GspF [Casimicrobiaceae bacterium]|nr:type II secretion system inner membrane protein GspF [Casimicrobiaceae bacterium]
MPAFRYEAVDAQGRFARGSLDAESARGARDRLRAQGLTPTAVSEARSFDGASVTRLAATEVAMFTRQWATLVHAGMPLVDAFSAVAEQADSPRAAKVAVGLRDAVATGEALPTALARYPRTFTPLYRSLVAAGADSGQLADVLSRLADYLEAREALKQKLTVALIYPVLVTVVAFSVIAVLLVYVVPQVISVYQQSKQTLPLLTRALIASSDFFRATAWVWIGIVVGTPIVLALASRSDAIRARMHAMLLATPAIGKLVAMLDTARFASTLAILAGSGTPLLRALDAAANVMRMRPLSDAARASASLVREGVPLARALKEQRVFPPVLVHLVANGEQTGRLPEMLVRAAGELERNAQNRLAWLAALLQPALIVVMGAIVLVLVLAVMLPIVSMNQLIR